MMPIYVKPTPLYSFSSKSDLVAAALRCAFKEHFPKKDLDGLDEKEMGQAWESRPHIEALTILYLRLVGESDEDIQADKVKLIKANRERVLAFYKSKIFPIPAVVAGAGALSTGEPADLDAKCFHGADAETGDTLFHLAIDPKIELALVKWLLRRGANPLTENKLHLAPVAYMMNSADLFTQFYRAWVIEQPEVRKKVEGIVAALKVHWTNYEKKLEDQEQTWWADKEMIDIRRRSLKALNFSMEMVDKNLYAIWTLMQRAEDLAMRAARGTLGSSGLHDGTIKFVEDLKKYFEGVETSSPYSKRAFVLAMNKILLKTAASHLSPAKMSSLRSQLPVDEHSLQQLLDELLFKEKSIWLSVWKFFESMVISLYRYDKNLKIRENRGPLIKYLLDNSAHLAARRRELNQYVLALSQLFGLTEILAYVKPGATGEESRVEYPKGRVVLPVFPPAAETIERYRQFHELGRLIVKLAGEAPRGIMGNSDLHGPMLGLWEAVNKRVTEWQASVLDGFFTPNLASNYENFRKFLESPKLSTGATAVGIVEAGEEEVEEVWAAPTVPVVVPARRGSRSSVVSGSSSSRVATPPTAPSPPGSNRVLGTGVWHHRDRTVVVRVASAGATGPAGASPRGGR